MQPSLSVNDTKKHIIMTALKLFAENGIASVSMRNVNREVGAKNNSAAHYHFGDKDGLIESILLFVQEWFENSREEDLKQLEIRAASEHVTIREIMEVWAAPYLKVIQTEAWGFDAVRFLARIQLEQDSSSQDLHGRIAEKVLKRLKTMVLRSMPDQPEAVLVQRLSYCIYAFVQGLAVSGHIVNSHQSSPAGSLEAITRISLDFCIGGMQAENTIPVDSKDYQVLTDLHLLF
ncbi:TetR/AcrR family transcriptional regulator [Pseudomonas monteilii]|uniref:TetR/AcrR family transcriptional regulator n=1 Tax=Pseudomonas monteilii TaxID=76759 RepID=UPI00382DA974